MISLIVTNTHNNRGKVIELKFTETPKYYQDINGRLYTINDFVEVETIDHEQAKADKMIDYWTMVSMTICEFKRKEVAHE